MHLRADPEAVLHHAGVGSLGEGGSSVHLPTVLLGDLGEVKGGGLGGLTTTKCCIRDDVDPLSSNTMLSQESLAHEQEEGLAVVTFR